MSPTNTPLSDLIGDDRTAGNDGDTPGFAQPVSQAEIEELLYGDSWTAAARVLRLTEIRAELAEMESSDLGEDDPLALIQEIDAAVARLNGLNDDGDGPTTDQAPEDHRETLSPDSDELEAIEANDEDSLEDDFETPLDEIEWVDGDGFDPKHGVH